MVLARFAAGIWESTLVNATGLGNMLIADADGAVAASPGSICAAAAPTLLELALLSEDAALSSAGEPPDTEDGAEPHRDALVGLGSSRGLRANAAAVLVSLPEYAAPGSVPAVDMASSAGHTTTTVPVPGKILRPTFSAINFSVPVRDCVALWCDLVRRRVARK